MLLRTVKLIILFASQVIFFSCNKTFLEKKSNKSLVVPTSLSDFEALMNNYDYVNHTSGLANIAADDFFSFDNDLLSFLGVEQNTYFWEKDMYAGWNSINDWNYPYLSIFYSNVTLEGLEKLTPAPHELITYNITKATAKTFRAYAVYSLLQAYAMPYSQANADKPGVPIRTSSNVNDFLPRSTLQESYDFVLKELKEALPLLPEKVTITYQPSKAAAYSILCRTYLAMENYEQAELYADSTLQQNNTLLDFNTLDAGLLRPFPPGDLGENPEVIMFGYSAGYGFLVTSTTYVDSLLYSMYDDYDLRKTCYYRPVNGYYNFKGSYTGNSSPHGGPCTDEIYLVKAECLARRGNTAIAMDTLNALLQNRFITNHFTPLTAADAEDALRIVLQERRKELVGRGTRFGDLRRLNNDPRFAVTISRLKDGIIKELPPKDIRYTLPIPDQEVLNSGIEQNPR